MMVANHSILIDDYKLSYFAERGLVHYAEKYTIDLISKKLLSSGLYQLAVQSDLIDQIAIKCRSNLISWFKATFT